MKIISGERKSGKTIRLVVESSKSNIPIVVLNEPWKRMVLDTAKWLGVEIPDPITIYEIPKHPDRIRNGVLVDEGQIILQKLLGVPVQTMTVTEYK